MEANRFEQLMQRQAQIPLRRKSTTIIRVEVKEDEEGECCKHEEPMRKPENERIPQEPVCTRPHRDEASKNLSRSEAVRIGKEECFANMNMILQEYYLK
jgi:hypothetical protein